MLEICSYTDTPVRKYMLGLLVSKKILIFHASPASWGDQNRDHLTPAGNRKSSADVGFLAPWQPGTVEAGEAFKKMLRKVELLGILNWFRPISFVFF